MLFFSIELFNNLSFFIILQNSLPCDQHTKLGYFYELIFDFFVANNYMFVSVFSFVLFVSLCMFHPAFYKIFEHHVRIMNGRDERRNYKKHIIDLIRFHMSISGYVIFVLKVSKHVELIKCTNDLKFKKISSLISVGLWNQLMFIVYILSVN